MLQITHKICSQVQHSIGFKKVGALFQKKKKDCNPLKGKKFLILFKAIELHCIYEIYGNSSHHETLNYTKLEECNI
jgi:hypothetical protein